jgi:hypothetical protein
VVNRKNAITAEPAGGRRLSLTVRDVADHCHGSLRSTHGGTPLIPFKSNTTGANGGLWRRAFHYFCYRREEFLARYHARSNIESTFSMIEGEFGEHIRSKTDGAMKYGTLCKVLAHNICVLIQEAHELGIQPVFWGEQPAEATGPAILRFPTSLLKSERDSKIGQDFVDSGSHCLGRTRSGGTLPRDASMSEMR